MNALSLLRGNPLISSLMVLNSLSKKKSSKKTSKINQFGSTNTSSKDVPKSTSSGKKDNGKQGSGANKRENDSYNTNDKVNKEKVKGGAKEKRVTKSQANYHNKPSISQGLDKDIDKNEKTKEKLKTKSKEKYKKSSNIGTKKDKDLKKKDSTKETQKNKYGKSSSIGTKIDKDLKKKDSTKEMSKTKSLDKYQKSIGIGTKIEKTKKKKDNIKSKQKKLYKENTFIEEDYLNFEEYIAHSNENLEYNLNLDELNFESDEIINFDDKIDNQRDITICPHEDEDEDDD